MSKKYIIAIVRMPVEILEDGTTINLNDRVNIELEYCKELPPIQENIHAVMDINNIKRFIEKEESLLQTRTTDTTELLETTINTPSNDVKLLVHPTEIKPPKNKYCNNTFKNKQVKKMNRHSVKNIHYSNT